MFAFLPLTLAASPYPFATYRISAEAYSESEGLPSPQIYTITQDGSRRIWVGTTRGLVAFDGEAWVPARHSSLEIGRLKVDKLATDSDGKVWAVLRSTALLRQIHGTRFELMHDEQLSQPPGATSFTGLAVQDNDTGKVVWAGTMDSGVLTLSADRRWVPREPSRGPVPRRIDDIVRHDNVVYINSDKGLGRVGGNGLYELRPTSGWGLPDSQLLAMAVEQAPALHPGRLWFVFDTVIGYVDGGLGQPFHTLANTPLLPRDQNPYKHAVVADGAGGVMFSVANHSYRVRADGSLLNFSTDAGLISNDAYAMYRDAENIIWIGSYRGLNKVRSLAFENVTQDLGLKEDIVTALTEGPDGTLYVGHSTGISIIRPSGIKHLSFGDQTTVHTRVMDMETGPKGRAWFTASRLGVGRIEANDRITWIPYAGTTRRGTPVSPSTTSLAFDTTAGPTAKDQLLVGGFNSLWTYDGRRLVPANQPFDVVGLRHMEADPNGGFYLSMNEKVVVHYQDGDVQSWPIRGMEGTPRGAFAILPQHDGTVLLGTGAGLYGIWDDEIQPFRPGGSDITRPVYALAYGPEGHLWIGTGHGMLRWDGHTLRRFDVLDGLGGFESNRDALLLDKFGTLWAGTSGGLSRYNPEFLNPILQPPPPTVVIDHLLVGGEALAPRDDLSVPNGKDITIQYEAISHLRQGNMTYHTLLRRAGQTTGIDIETRARKTTYPNLAPGIYEFSVVAINDIGQVSTAETLPHLHVELPFYQKPGVIVIAIVVILGVMLLMVQYYIVRRSALRLEVLVEERTHQLREQSEAYRSLIQNAVVGIATVKRTGTLVNVNPAMTQLLGCDDTHDLLGYNLRDDIATNREAWDRLMSQAGSHDGRLTDERAVWRRCDGQEILVRVSGRLTTSLDGDGQSSAELFVQDITSVEHARQARLEADRLRDVQKLAVTVAHEFNNPLSILLTTYQLFVQPRLDSYDPPVRERLEKIPGTVHRMKELVNKLLKITRLKEEEYLGSTSFLNLSESADDDVSRVQDLSDRRADEDDSPSSSTGSTSASVKR